MSMARECLKKTQTKRYTVPQIGIDIKETKVTASKNFSWKKVITELEAFTPPSRRYVQREATQNTDSFHPVGSTAKTSLPPERNCTTTSS